MNNKIVIGIGGIIIGLVLATFFTSTIYPYRNGGFEMMGWRSNSDSNQGVAGNTQIASTTDKHFIEQMIPHHEGAIAMANLALEKAKRPEIKMLAQAIVSAQESENQQMKSWYRDWFGKEVPKGSAMTGGMMSQGGMHMGGQEDVAALENAADFDKAFLEAMIPHHQMAIMMARMLESGTARPEMQQLAKNIISSQAKEIQQMQGWYAQWYR